MNLTSYVQDRQLTIALRGEIDHHAAREIMQALSAKSKISTFPFAAFWTSAM